MAHGGQVCAIVGVHKTTVHAWINSGELKAIKKGSKVIRIRRGELERFLAEGEVWPH